MIKLSATLVATKASLQHPTREEKKCFSHANPEPFSDPNQFDLKAFPRLFTTADASAESNIDL